MVIDRYLLPSCFLASMTDNHLLKAEASVDVGMSLGTGSSLQSSFRQDDHNWNVRKDH